MGINFEHGPYGVRAIVTSPWKADFLRLLKRNSPQEIELNYAKGWTGEDITFLHDFPDLLALKVTDFKIKSISTVQNLHALRSLKLSVGCPAELDFSLFPQLEECVLEWQGGYDSVFNSTSLRRLFVNCYDGSDLELFGRVRTLEELTILSAKVTSIEPLGRLSALKYLRLANLRRLASLSGIERLTNLESLSLDTCRRISSIDELRSLKNLDTLHLTDMGDIQSLSPLSANYSLKNITFTGTTNIVDGDLSLFLDRPNICTLAFQNRKHYSHKREEISPNYR